MHRTVEGVIASITFEPGTDRTVLDSKLVQGGLTFWTDNLIASSEGVVTADLAALQVLEQECLNYVEGETFWAQVSSAYLF